jgi:predicted membrane metal-binding protein
MQSALALLAGALAGSAGPSTVDLGAACIAAWVCAATGLWLRQSRLALCFVLSGYLLCGWAIGAEGAHRVPAPLLRLALDEAFGRFRFNSLGPPGVHAPIQTRVRLTEDAARRDGGVTLRAHVLWIRNGDAWRPAFGMMRLSVSGAIAARTAGQWRAGRVIEAPVTFRRPARYLNAGVADLERAAAFHGAALNESIKSALLLEIIDRGGWFDERAAAVRARVRRAVDGTVGRTGPVNAAIVTAIRIGDRTGLPTDVRERLQAAGTYHVIAISGGNVAMLAAGVWWTLALTGAGGRVRAGVTIVVLAAYAATVTASPSVWRATVMATFYLAARLVDNQSPPPGTRSE